MSPPTNPSYKLHLGYHDPKHEFSNINNNHITKQTGNQQNYTFIEHGGPDVDFAGVKHFISLKDFTSNQILHLVRRSLEIKHFMKNNKGPQNERPLQGKTLGMIFSKRSTRTRVSAEAGWAYFGGHPMFLGKEDIQLAGGEPLKDTSIVVSSMVDAILARVGAHSEIETLAQYSTVPVINALTAKFHPLQILADLMTIYELYCPDALIYNGPSPLPVLPNLHVAWVGDSNNILQSLLVTLPRLGISMSVATPTGYDIDDDVMEFVKNNSKFTDPELAGVSFTRDPLVAVKGADMLITDTWVSMGQESEKAKRLQEFAGYQITEKMASDGGAKKDWKFLHCLPRKPEEVDDEVFYNPQRSAVFQEAENRKYTVMAVYEMLMLNN